MWAIETSNVNKHFSLSRADPLLSNQLAPGAAVALQGYLGCVSLRPSSSQLKYSKATSLKSPPDTGEAPGKY